MSIIDSLIYDRTQEDVDRVFELKNKILSGGVSSLTSEELEEYLAGMKGAYNATDLNRVGEASAFLAERFISIPNEILEYLAEKGVADDDRFHVPYDRTTVVVTAKRDWTMADVPTQSQVSALFADLAVLRKQLTLPDDAPGVPSTLDSLTYTTANEIEYLLWLVNAAMVEMENGIYAEIDATGEAFMYCGEVFCGE